MCCSLHYKCAFPFLCFSFLHRCVYVLSVKIALLRPNNMCQMGSRLRKFYTKLMTVRGVDLSFYLFFC